MAGVATTGIMTSKGVEAAETEPDNLPSLIQFESKYNKIEYTSERKDLDQPTIDLIRSVVGFCNNLNQLQGVKQMEANRPSEVSMQPVSRAELESLKRKSWAEIKKLVPEVPDFSNRAFIKFLIHDLPRLLAPYGVFSKSIFKLSAEGGSERFSQDVIVLFKKIEKIESIEIEQWGRKIKRDVLYLDDLAEAGEQSASLNSAGGVGQTFYRNVVIDPGKIIEQTLYTDERSKKVVELLSASSLKDRLDLAEKNDNPRNMAAAIGSTLLEMKRDRNNYNKEEVANVIVHETSHLVDQHEEKYLETFRPKPNSKFSTEIKGFFSDGAHEEIDGLLGELRYDKDKHIALQHILYGYIENNRSRDFIHSRAGTWVGDRLITRILQNPSAWGVVIDPQGRGTPQLQALIQFANLLDKKEMLEKFAEELHTEHWNNLKEELIKSSTEVGLPEKTSWDAVAPYAVATLLAAGGFWVALKKLNDRRNAIKAEQTRIQRNKQSRNKRKKKTNK